MKIFMKDQPHWALAAIAVLVVAIYWSVIATDRYVSESHIVLQSPEVNPAAFNVSSLLSGTSGSGDLLLLKDHLQSVDILQKLEQRLALRQHYSSSDIDWFARLTAADLPQEKFVEYMRSRITIEFDDYAAVLRVKVQAYDAQKARQIAQALLEEGELHMNQMGQRLAAEQVAFIESQVSTLEKRLFSARQALLDYQNQHGLVSPTGSVQSIAAIVSQLEGQRALIEARISSLAKFQSKSSPDMLKLAAELQALNQQISNEQRKMATESGDALNKVSAEYQTLELKAQFSLNLYSNALLALETTRVEASRKLKQVSVLQQPSLPEYSTEPRRLYNWLVFSFFILFVAAMVHLIRAIVLEHRD